jgi:hypothetical protein
MNKKYIVRLSDEERGVCQDIVKRLKLNTRGHSPDKPVWRDVIPDETEVAPGRYWPSNDICKTRRLDGAEIVRTQVGNWHHGNSRMAVFALSPGFSVHVLKAALTPNRISNRSSSTRDGCPDRGTLAVIASFPGRRRFRRMSPAWPAGRTLS